MVDAMRGEWECIPCHDEGTRAAMARQQERDAIVNHVRAMMVEGESFDVLVDTDFRVIKGGAVLWEAISRGSVEALRIRAVPVALGREMEVRSSVAA